MKTNDFNQSIYNKKAGHYLIFAAYLLVLLWAVTGCGMDTSEGGGSAGKDGTITFTSTGGEFQLTAGKEWQAMTGELHPEAELEIGSLSKDKYLILIPESKIDLAMSLSDYTKIVQDVTAAGLADCLITEPTAITVNGQDAYVTKISGTIDGLNVYYWVYTIDCPDHLVQIIAWTLKSRKESYAADIESVVQSFRLTPKAESSEAIEESEIKK